ncbi:CPBP family intramembrane glutamic endopeptidase [Aliterella atlantica]|uniref:CPBP family intramembrane glutamic endopeptidase n=1 Tax=Aliterella atlantica TaxID=1827278 RepID=UPI0005D3BA0C
MASIVSNLPVAKLFLLSFGSELPVAAIRVIGFFAAWVSLWLPLAIASTIILQKIKVLAASWQPFNPITTEQKLPLLASLYLIAPLVLWGANRVIGYSFADYGAIVNWSTLQFLGVGFGIGVVGLAILFGGQTVLGWVKWQQIPKQQIISVSLPILPLAIWISGIEELIFRGFVFTQLQQEYSVVISAAICSLIFALLHLIWEQTETKPQLAGLWLMGMVLVLARYINSGSLGLAWGLHSGWVWAIATLDTAGLVTYTGNAPEWITGKYGKPLAGIAGIIFLAATGAILWLVRRG